MSINTKYFGTDGFRGEANIELTALHAFKIGRFLGWYFGKSEHKPRIAVGKDTRLSSYMLEYAVASGIASSGADAYMLHVTTTPSISFIVTQEKFDCGIMITASHNPFSDNGIKVINRRGEKIEDDVIELIELYIDGNMNELMIDQADLPLAAGEDIGKIVDHTIGREKYIAHLISLAKHNYNGLKIGIDCANGSSWSIAKTIFNALGAETHIIGADPNGTNINVNCGSMHIEVLQKFVKENNLDIGFAFDGDADRCIAVDERGNIVDGDKILYILAIKLKNKGLLNGNTVVTTVMSNLALVKALGDESINCKLTAVGDRYVYSAMKEGDYQLGGEQSGHIILRKYANTGDGLLTAIMLAEEIKEKNCPFSMLSENLELYPQIIKNYKVQDKHSVMKDNHLIKQIEALNDRLHTSGRVLIRASGTENLIRVLVEAQTEEACNSLVVQIEQMMKERNYIQ